MKNMKLTRNEVMACRELFEKIATEPAVLDRMLQTLGKDPAGIRAELNQGVNDFYNLYEGEVNTDTIQAKMDEATASMTTLERYSYYANLMTAFSHLGGRVFNDEAWTKCLADHQNILSAIELGLIDGNDPHITDGLDQMRQIVAENIEAFAILFVDDPDMETLLEACMTRDTATVQAMALNSRELAVDMAAAVYVMQERGELKSLGSTRYSPRDIAVMTASGLEIDAARKTGNLETVKKVIRKASVAAVALVVTAPFALAAGLVSWFFLETTALVLATSFEMYLGLLTIATLVSCVAMLVFGTPIFDSAKATVNKLVEKGARVLSTTVEAVKPLFGKVTAWIRNTVVPAALPIWEKCRSFTYHRILVPTAAFILKHKDTILQGAGKIIQKAKDIFQSITHKAVDVYHQGSQAVENIINSAKNLAAEETTGEDAGAETVTTDANPVEYDVPITENTDNETPIRENPDIVCL